MYLHGSPIALVPPTYYNFNGRMRSNIRYVQPELTAQLRRLEERVRQLEDINDSLMQNNEKLGRYLHEMNECHRQKARILQDSMQELEGKLS